MAYTLIDGKALSFKIKESIRAEVDGFTMAGRRAPGLAVIIAGDDSASKIYVRNKIKACQETGIRSFSYDLPASATESEIAALIDKLNADPEVDGLLVQVPLPAGMDEKKLLPKIRADKDVDGFGVFNIGSLSLGIPELVSCTPLGCLEMIKSTGVPIAGKRAVVIGRSNTVGKPMAQLLLMENATVTVCHSKTADLPSVTREADILVAAIGRARFVTRDMVKPGAVVIDVGMNRGEDGKLCGDVDFDAVKEIAGHITPVPGGVGLMTVAMLMYNTVKAYKRHELV